MGIIYILENRIPTSSHFGWIRVGQTIQTFKNRLKGYKGKRENNPISNDIKKYGIENFNITIEENIPEDFLDFIEVSMVYSCNCRSPNGYNFETGGNKNKHVSEESKRKMSIAKIGKYDGKNNPMYGVHLTGERNPMYGRRGERAPAYGRTGNKHPMFGRIGEKNPNFGKIEKRGKDHPRSKPTLQFSKDGTFIKKWECIMQIERELGFGNQDIGKVCLGKRKTSKGFIWKFAPVSLLLQP